MTAAANQERRAVLIVGGGLAGLAAASVLGPRGFQVTLLEARPRLGGRASSFLDTRSGEWIDNCQHVSMGCCTNLADFCARVGIEGYFRRDRRLHFIGPDGRRSDMFASSLPAPFHLAPSFLRMAFLDAADKLAIGRGLARLALDSTRSGRTETADPSHERRTFSEWLADARQPPRAISHFWSAVLTSALSEQCDRIDPRYARKVFVEGFLVNRSGYEMLLPTAPLGELYGERLGRWLGERGIEIVLAQAARALEVHEKRVTGLRLRDGRLLTSDFYVAAVPGDRLLDLLPRSLKDSVPYFDRLTQLETAPITSIHLWFDRPITRLPHAILLGRLSQWLFNRNALQATPATPRNDEGGMSGDPKGFYYQVVVSASRELSGVSRQAVIRGVCRELASIWPMARSARLLHARVVTERSAVFSPAASVEAVRPSQKSPLDNLWVAGDWTKTGWPATMEGAVRSGYLAAESVLAAAGRPEEVLKPELQPGRLAGWLLRFGTRLRSR